jgi:hypothetical protein
MPSPASAGQSGGSNRRPPSPRLRKHARCIWCSVRATAGGCVTSAQIALRQPTQAARVSERATRSSQPQMSDTAAFTKHQPPCRRRSGTARFSFGLAPGESSSGGVVAAEATIQKSCPRLGDCSYSIVAIISPVRPRLPLSRRWVLAGRVEAANLIACAIVCRSLSPAYRAQEGSRRHTWDARGRGRAGLSRRITEQLLLLFLQHALINSAVAVGAGDTAA